MVRVSARTDAARGALLGVLFAAGALGVQEDGGDLVTHLADPVDDDALRRALDAADPGVAIEIAPTPDVDWTARWKEGMRAHRIGGLTVAPPWLADQFDAATTIVIEPAMAFGTGEHATTRGVLRLLQTALRAGDRVADLGAGSAVLSIAAAKLGAARVVAIEMDDDAIGNAEQNIAANGVGDRVRLVAGDAAVVLPLIAPVDLVVANILSTVLCELLPAIGAALSPGGRAIVAGILGTERDTLRAAFAAGGWREERDDEEGEWWSATIARP
jgi:ribosomal protein L11 methyltransferase